VISLLGMLAGTVVVRFVTTPLATWTALLFLLSIHLSTNYLAVRAVVMTSLNRQRANIVFSELVATDRILTPQEVAHREKVFEEDGVLRWRDGARLGIAKIGVTLGTLLEKAGSRDRKTGSLQIARPAGRLEGEADELDLTFATSPYVLWWDRRTRTAYITLQRNCSAFDQLVAWFHALLLAKSSGNATAVLPAIDAKTGFHRAREILLRHTDGLKAAGWDLDAAVLETRPGARVG
jgi:hypothetical protein